MNNGSKEMDGVTGVGLVGQQWTADKLCKPDGNAGHAVQHSDLSDTKAPDPEVTEKTVKRKFSTDYKARIVREADTCTEPGQIGALLRREGLYSSQLTQWRRAYLRGALAGLRDDKRGRKRTKDPLEVENEELKRRNARLVERLDAAEVIIDIQKKLSGLLGIPLPSEENEGKS